MIMMSKACFLFVAFVVFMIQPGLRPDAHAQRKGFGLAIEGGIGYARVADGAFTDPQVENYPSIAHGWLNNVKDGLNWSAKLMLYVPFGFRLYGGYQRTDFAERTADGEFWTHIYSQDFINHFALGIYSVQNRIEGVVLGAAYAFAWLKGKVRPVLFGEIQRQRLRSNTHLTGEADRFWSIFGPISGTFLGYSSMTTTEIKGPAWGLGLEIDLGRLVLVPSWKFISGEAQITERTVQYNIFPQDGHILQEKTFGDLDVLDEQKINLDHSIFSLAVRFILFQTK